MKLRSVALALCLSFVLCGCGTADPVPHPTPTPVQSAQPAPTPTPTPEPTATPTPTPEPPRDWISLDEFVTQINLEIYQPIDPADVEQWLHQAGVQTVDWNAPVQRQVAFYLMARARDLGDCKLPTHLLPYPDAVDIDPRFLTGFSNFYRTEYYPPQLAADEQGNLLPESLLKPSDIPGLAILFGNRSAEPTPTDEELLDYFSQIVLHTEYGDSGSTESVQLSRWTGPIYYICIGDPTKKDKEVLRALADELNRIEGFPGIYETVDEQEANITLSFLSREEMDTQTSHLGGGFDGFVTYYWYTDSHEIYHADIKYCTDMDDFTRSGVLCEELIQALGMSNDSYDYPYSIFYQDTSCIRWPAPIDWTLIELLYHPALQTGMNEQTVRQILPFLLNSVS